MVDTVRVVSAPNAVNVKCIPEDVSRGSSSAPALQKSVDCTQKKTPAAGLSAKAASIAAATVRANPQAYEKLSSDQEAAVKKNALKRMGLPMVGTTSVVAGGYFAIYAYFDLWTKVLPAALSLVGVAAVLFAIGLALYFVFKNKESEALKKENSAKAEREIYEKTLKDLQEDARKAQSTAQPGLEPPKSSTERQLDATTKDFDAYAARIRYLQKKLAEEKAAGSAR